MSRRPAAPVRARSGSLGAPAVVARAKGRGPARPGGTAPRNPRPAARPARASTPREVEAAEPRPVRMARLLSVRALVLSVVLLVAFTVLFPTVRAYLGQRAELDALAVEVDLASQAEEELAAELDRWDDDAYVAAQARERLRYVNPGEIPYVVIDADTVVEETVTEGAADGPVAGPAVPAGGAGTPWYTTVWDSLEVAGSAEVVPAGD